MLMKNKMLTDAMVKVFNQYGLEVSDTGGGCQAYMNEGKPHYVMITDGENGDCLPTFWGDSLTIGIYNSDDGDCVGLWLCEFDQSAGTDGLSGFKAPVSLDHLYTEPLPSEIVSMIDTLNRIESLLSVCTVGEVKYRTIAVAEDVLDAAIDALDFMSKPVHSGTESAKFAEAKRQLELCARPDHVPHNI